MTGSKPERRWKDGHGYGKTHFGFAIKKYGWDAFDHVILLDNLSKKEAQQAEIRLIALYQTNNREKGFNCTIGGDGARGHKASPETIEKLRKSHLGIKASPESNRKRSESLLRYYQTHEHPKFSEVHMRRFQEGRRNAPREHYSHPCSDEKKQKLREANLGKKASTATKLKMREKANKRSVIAYDENGVVVAMFVSCRDASRWLGTGNCSHMTECCQGKRKSYKQLKWKYNE